MSSSPRRAGRRRFRRGTADAVTAFVEGGGAFVATGVDSQAAFEGLIPLVPTNAVPSFRADQEPRECDMLRPDHSTLFTWPSFAKNIEPSPRGGFELPGPSARVWSAPGRRPADNRALVLLLRRGRGLLILSAASFRGSAFPGNVAKALELQRVGLSYDGMSCENWDTGERTRTPSFGHGYLDCRLRNTSATNASVTAALDIVSGDGSRTFRNRGGNPRPNDSFSVRMQGLFTQNGPCRATLTITDGKTGTPVLLDTFDLDLPDTLEIEPPFYRASVSTARRESDVRLALVLNVYAESIRGRAASVALSSPDGKELARKEVVFTDAPRAEFTLPLDRNAPAGVYTVRATVPREVAGRTAEAEGVFHVVPVRKGQVFLDQDGVILRDGKPWFPIGLYHVPPEEIEQAAATGIDFMQFWDSHCTPGPTGSLARAAAAGLRILLEDGIWGAVVNTMGNPPERYRFETDARFHAREAFVRDAPSGVVAFWYTADEPGRESLPGILKAKAHRATMDPDHPTWVVSTGDPKLGDGGDVLGLDIYARYHKGKDPMTRVSDAIDRARRHRPAGQPVVAVNQAFGNYEMHHETPAEVRCMSYLAYAHGVRGIIWYCWRDGGEQGIVFHEDTRREVADIIAETKVFREALLVPGGNIAYDASGLDALSAAATGVFHDPATGATYIGLYTRTLHDPSLIIVR